MLLRSDYPASSFELLLAVGRITVDESAPRERCGEQFASPPAEADIAGTRDNMLDVPAYPDGRIAGHLAARPDGDEVTLKLALKDTVVQRSVPISLEIGADSLWAQAALEIDHAEPGLAPFSVLFGALRDAETMEIKFSLIARRRAIS